MLHDIIFLYFYFIASFKAFVILFGNMYRIPDYFE